MDILLFTVVSLPNIQNKPFSVRYVNGSKELLLYLIPYFKEIFKTIKNE